MTTNGANNVEDAEMAECEGEKVVTMMDVLQEEQDFEDDANAVLGASDEKNCTYSKGYIKRQAIYACLTCCSEAKDDPTKRAGVCLACSLNCHENHDLVELYTKRNFRCDCGNPNFNSHPCQFTPDKNDFNDDNSYNQNFSGLYCNCHRPYPDPEATIEDEEMIQCIICEDWLHASHLDAVVPSSDQYSEMVCKACMEKNEFLHDYSSLAVNVETGDVDGMSSNGTSKIKLTNGDFETDKLVNGTGELSKDTTKKPERDMDVDENQTENTSTLESVKTVENQVSEKPDENREFESNDVTEKTEMSEDPSQTSSNVISDSQEDTNTAIISNETEDTLGNEVSEDKENAGSLKTVDALESNVSKDKENAVTGKETENNLESQVSEDKESSSTFKETEISLESKVTEDQDRAITQELNETSVTNPEESKASEPTQEPEDTKDVGEKDKQDTPENEKLEENCGKNTENLETTRDGTDDVTEKTSENENGEDVAKLDSENSDPKQDEIIQSSENEVTCDDTKTSSENYSNQISADIEMNDLIKETATENSDESKDKDGTNRTDDAKTDEPSNENTCETELHDSVSKIQSNDVSKHVNLDETSNVEVSNETVNSADENKENKRKLPTEDFAGDNLAKKPKLDDENTCNRPKSVKKVYKGATFWPSNFRQKLCTCSECLSMYKDLSVLFLIDPEDTVFAYETLGKERLDGRATQYEKGLEALSSLDRIQQINALTEYNKMKDKLLDFLKSFKDRKEIVKEEDIKAFFAGMKPKREPDGVYFCR